MAMKIYANYLIKCCRQQNTFSIDQYATRGVSIWPFMVWPRVATPLIVHPETEGMAFGYDGPAEAAENCISQPFPKIQLNSSL